jgi:hypothetical protein
VPTQMQTSQQPLVFHWGFGAGIERCLLALTKHDVDEPQDHFSTLSI